MSESGIRARVQGVSLASGIAKASGVQVFHSAFRLARMQWLQADAIIGILPLSDAVRAHGFGLDDAASFSLAFIRVRLRLRLPS